MRQYTTPENRFQPFKDIRIGINSLEKKCSKHGEWIPLNSENFDRDYKRSYGYHSQCKHCQRSYGIEYRRKLSGKQK